MRGVEGQERDAGPLPHDWSRCGQSPVQDHIFGVAGRAACEEIQRAWDWWWNDVEEAVATHSNCCWTRLSTGPPILCGAAVLAACRDITLSPGLSAVQFIALATSPALHLPDHLTTMSRLLNCDLNCEPDIPSRREYHIVVLGAGMRLLIWNMSSEC